MVPMPKSKYGFEYRDKVVVEIGLKNWDDYLKSALWEQIFNVAIISYDRGRCRLCYKLAQCIYHFQYDIKTLTGDANQNLIPLCHGCHKYVETDKLGRKRKFGESRRAYWKRAYSKTYMRKVNRRIDWVDRNNPLADL